MAAVAIPGPLEIILLLGVFAFSFIVLTLALRMTRNKRTGAFPVIPTAEPDGPGSYLVKGVDRNSREDRQLTVTADSRANAQVKAELEGIVVTAITKTPA